MNSNAIKKIKRKYFCNERSFVYLFQELWLLNGKRKNNCGRN